MSEKRASNEALAEEARRWDLGELTLDGWKDAPDAILRADAAELVGLRLPKPMLVVLREFARREGVGLPVLNKRWLDDRIRHEHERRKPVTTLGSHEPGNGA